MSDLKRGFVEDPCVDTQKTSTIKNNVNNDITEVPFSISDLKNKKLKHFHHSSITQSLINNYDMIKIAHHNVMSFVNPTKQNQVIQEALLNNIDILGLSEINLSHIATKYQKTHLPEDYVYFFESTKLNKGSGVGLCIKKSLSNHIFHHYQNHGRYIFMDLQLRNKQKLCIIQIYLHANNSQINV